MNVINKRLPHITAAAAAIIFGFSFLFTKNALDYLDIFQLIGLRFLIAAFVLTILKVIGVLKINVHMKNIKLLLLVALFQPVIYFICETMGVNLTSASESGIIISLVPIAITLFAVFLLKEQLSWVQWASVFISVAGVIIIISGSDGNGSKSFVGVLFLLGAVISAGLYNVFSRKVSKSYTPVEITYVMMLVGAIAFNTIGIANAFVNGSLQDYFKVLLSIHVLVDIFYLGILSSIFAFFMLNYSLSKIEASRVAVYMNLTPIVSVFAGVFFRNEKFFLYQCIGGIVVLIGLCGVNYKRQADLGYEALKIE